MPLLLDKIFSPKVFRDIDEPMICGSSTVFIQNSSNCSKITVNNIKTGKIKSVTMKGILCFNVHTDNNNVAYEFSGRKRGIGILYVSRLEIKEYEIPGTDAVLGGIWGNLIILKRGCEIVLYDISKSTEKVLTPYHHMLGAPAAGGGNCAWLQIYKDKCYITIYSIENGYTLTFIPTGYVNRIYVFQDYLAYQSCYGNRCCVYTYNLHSGKLIKCFESHNWIELYSGKDNTLVWTVRKLEQGRYIYDMWVYDICTGKMEKILHDYQNTVIPTASNEAVIWVEESTDGDNLYLTRINLQ